MSTETIKASNLTFTQSQSTKKLLKWAKEDFERWEMCPKRGQLICNCFLPIKAPLSSVYEIHYTKDSIFSPTDLVESLVALAQKDQTPLDIGLVIDITGNDLYYHDSREWEDWDVEYIKLSFQVIDNMPPTDENVKDFIQQVNSFRKTEERAIAVYCANGYNLTGYFIVCYLIEACRMQLETALKAFSDSCAPGIYSQILLTALYQKYHLVVTSPRIHCPDPPQWDLSSKIGGKGVTEDCLTEEHKKNAYKPAVTPSSSSSGKTRMLPPPPAFSAEPPKKRRRLRTWCDEVPPMQYGQSVVNDSEEYKAVRAAFSRLTGMDGDLFPGCETVSLSASHIGQSALGRAGSLTKSYLVTWRARGRRCMMLIVKEGVYLISRDLSIVKVDLHFPRKKQPEERLNDTLLDGILVEDRDGAEVVPRYLAFDMVMLEGKPVYKSPFDRRLQCLQNEIILPRKQDKQHDYTKESIRIRMKDHFRIGKTEYLLKSFIPKITHQVEGLIFTPSKAPYGLGGYETPDPLFKFVGGDDGPMSFDGSLPSKRVLAHVALLESNNAQ